MTLIDRLYGWRTRGKISEDQFRDLASLVRRQRFSVFFELSAMLYLGVFAFVGGLGWTIKTYALQLGDSVILLGLSLIFAACLIYCVRKAAPYTSRETSSPTFAFDYILYLACLTFSVAQGYMETRFHILQVQWDLYLLASALFFFVLAYRFDNRFVLSLGLSTLAAWFGIKISQGYGYLQAPLRPCAIAYGFTIALAGIGLARLAVKRHFLDTYLQIAVNMVLLASFYGITGTHLVVWPVLLFSLAGAAITYGVQSRQFSFVTYGVLYSYAGFDVELARAIGWSPWMSFYYLLSSGFVIVVLIFVSRHFGAES